MIKLDAINIKILSELQDNARIPNVKLAERVGLSSPACLRRVQELEEAGAITGYHAAINNNVLGKSFVAFTTVGISDHSKASLDHFESIILRSPEVVECHKVTGTIEFILKIEVADITAYEHFHSDVLGAISHVVSINSYVVIRSAKTQIK